MQGDETDVVIATPVDDRRDRSASNHVHTTAEKFKSLRPEIDHLRRFRNTCGEPRLDGVAIGRCDIKRLQRQPKARDVTGNNLPGYIPGARLIGSELLLRPIQRAPHPISAEAAIALQDRIIGLGDHPSAKPARRRGPTLHRPAAVTRFSRDEGISPSGIPRSCQLATPA